jgi:hypothetical protein
MCLTVDQQATKKFKKWYSGRTIKVWKLVDSSGIEPLMSKWNHYVWTPGYKVPENLSLYKLYRYRLYNFLNIKYDINEAIHVYLDKPQDYDISIYDIPLQLELDVDDILGIEVDGLILRTATCTKVLLTQESYDAAIALAEQIREGNYNNEATL